MKILISPSKTADYRLHPLLEDKPIHDPEATKRLLRVIRKLSKANLGKALAIKGALLDQTYQQYRNATTSETYHAFASFTGLVYKQLDLSAYNALDFAYINDHVRILDALYGVLEPGTLIVPYRLDMKAKIGINLYQYWNVDDALDDDVIINLASNEFASMVHLPMVTIQFLQRENDQHVNLATYAKVARGKLLDHLIRNRIMDLADVRSWNGDGYRYNEALSDANTIVFSR